MTETDREFLLVDDRGDRRVFDPIGNGDLVATLEQEARSAIQPVNGWRILLSIGGGLIAALVFGTLCGVVPVIAATAIILTNLVHIVMTLGGGAAVALGLLVLVVLAGISRYERRPSRRESLVSLSMWRLMHDCCGNCGTDLAGNSVKDDGCSVCDRCGGAWLRVKRLPPPPLNWTWRDRLMARGRFRERDLGGHVSVTLPFRERRALLDMYGITWLPRGWVLLALLASVLTGHCAYRVVTGAFDAAGLTTGVFITACVLLGALAARVWTARLRMRRVWLAYVASGCCPTCETQLQQGGDMQRCLNCGAVWPAA